HLDFHLGDLDLLIFAHDGLETGVAFGESGKHRPVHLQDFAFAADGGSDRGGGENAVCHVVRADIDSYAGHQARESGDEGNLGLGGVGDDASHLRVGGSDVDERIELAGDVGIRLIVGRNLIAVAVIGLDSPAAFLRGGGRAF